MSSVQEREGKLDKLQNKHFWAYGVGHLFNDVTNSCWLYYLIFYLNRIVKTPAAPYVFLVGQVVDGFCTPVIAILSDRISTRFGKRIPWYVAGFILVSIGNPPLYLDINSQELIQFVYYLAFSILWNLGWAAVQVNHLSLLPSLTLDRVRRDRLNNLRTTFVYVSSLIVLGSGVLIFQFMDSPEIEFFIVAIVSQAVGTTTSFFFICVIRQNKLAIDLPQENKEKQELKASLLQKEENQVESNADGKHVSSRESEQRGQKVEKQSQKILNWLKVPAFYLCCVCYVGVKIDNSSFGVFLAFYLANVLKLGQASKGISFHIALAPLLIYLVAIVVTSQLIKLYKLLGRKKVLTIGTAFGIVSLVGFYVLTPEYSGLIYFFAVFRGISSGLVLTTGTNLVTDIIGNKGNSSAFVYGVYQFMNKCTIGLVVYLVTHSAAYSKDSDFSDEDIQYIRMTTCVVPGVACLIGTLGILFCPVPEYINKNTTVQQSESSSHEEKSMIDSK